MPEPTPAISTMVTLDPVAAHYMRQADFLRNEGLVQAAQLRDALAALKEARAEIERLSPSKPPEQAAQASGEE